MEESIMKKFAALWPHSYLAGPLAAASKDEKETDRLEIAASPQGNHGSSDDIPQTCRQADGHYLSVVVKGALSWAPVTACAVVCRNR